MKDFEELLAHEKLLKLVSWKDENKEEGIVMGIGYLLSDSVKLISWSRNWLKIVKAIDKFRELGVIDLSWAPIILLIYLGFGKNEIGYYLPSR